MTNKNRLDIAFAALRKIANVGGRDEPMRVTAMEALQAMGDPNYASVVECKKGHFLEEKSNGDLYCPECERCPGGRADLGCLEVGGKCASCGEPVPIRPTPNNCNKKEK